MVSHRVRKLIFVHRIPLDHVESFRFQSDLFRRAHKRGDLMPPRQRLLNNLLPRLPLAPMTNSFIVRFAWFGWPLYSLASFWSESPFSAK